MRDLSEPTLKKLAGDVTYRRGLDYFKSGAVEEIRIKGNIISATVMGSMPYQVKLRLSNQGVDGSCDCPASDGMDFCKHCVATALVYLQQKTELDSLSQGDGNERITACLMQMDKPQLIKEIMTIIEHDPHLEKRWLQKADRAAGNVDPKILKKQITQALPYKQLWDYRQVNYYFNEAESLLEGIVEQLDVLDAEKSLMLVDYAIARLNKACEQIDTSNGQYMNLQTLLSEALVKAYRRLPWTAEEKSQYLFTHLNHSLDIFPSVPDDFLDASQQEVEQAFYLRVQQAWDRLPALSPNADWQVEREYIIYARLLEKKAEANQDLNKLVQLKSKVAIRVHQFSDLCELSIQLKDYTAAEYWLAKMQQDKQQNNQSGCLCMQIKLAQAQNKMQDAFNLQWQMFSQTQNTTDYEIWLKLAKQTGASAAACYQQAENYLLEQMSKTKHAAWNVPSYEVMAFYIKLQQFDKALAIAKNYKVDINQLHQLAANILPHETEHAMALYQSVIVHTAGLGDNKNYEQAIAWLKELKKGLDKKNDAPWQARFDNFITGLRTELKRKRNFILLLDKYFAVS